MTLTLEHLLDFIHPCPGGAMDGPPPEAPNVTTFPSDPNDPDDLRTLFEDDDDEPLITFSQNPLAPMNGGERGQGVRGNDCQPGTPCWLRANPDKAKARCPRCSLPVMAIHCSAPCPHCGFKENCGEGTG